MLGPALLSSSLLKFCLHVHGSIPLHTTKWLSGSLIVFWVFTRWTVWIINLDSRYGQKIRVWKDMEGWGMERNWSWLYTCMLACMYMGTKTLSASFSPSLVWSSNSCLLSLARLIFDLYVFWKIHNSNIELRPRRTRKLSKLTGP